MLQFWSILDPTWLYFGGVLGAKLEPKWYQIALKIDPNIDQFFDASWLGIVMFSVFFDFWIQELSHVGSKMHSKIDFKKA